MTCTIEIEKTGEIIDIGSGYNPMAKKLIKKLGLDWNITVQDGYDNKIYHYSNVVAEHHKGLVNIISSKNNSMNEILDIIDGIKGENVGNFHWDPYITVHHAPKISKTHTKKKTLQKEKKKSKLKKIPLELIKEGVYFNIYQKYVNCCDVEEWKVREKAIPIYEFLNQLKAINKVHPNMVCISYTIDFINIGNTNPRFEYGEKYGHKHSTLTNEENISNKVETLGDLIEGVKFVISHFEDSEIASSYDYLVQKCNILCMNGKSQKNKKRKTLSKSIRHEVFKKDGFKCVECGATKENTTLHVDHILPVAQGGSDELDNLQTLCEACNLSKSNRYWKGGQ